MADGEVGLGYWMRWQVPVCALIMAIPAATAVAMISRGRSDPPLRSVHLWVPCWRSLHPLWLLAYRGAVFLIMSWLLYQMVLIRGAFAFYFYTQWTFALVIFYFAIGTILSANGCWSYSKNITQNEEASTFLRRDLEENTRETLYSGAKENWNTIKLQSYDELGGNEQEAGFWGYMMQVVFQTSAGAAMLTDIVFWGLLVPFLSSVNFRLNLVMGCMHSLNLAFLLLDTLLNSLPFPGFRIAYFILWSCIYVIFQWVLHACGFSWWPYPFLELATPWAPLWYLCLALVHIPCYGFYYMIVKAKNSYFTKIFPGAYFKATLVS